MWILASNYFTDKEKCRAVFIAACILSSENSDDITLATWVVQIFFACCAGSMVDGELRRVVKFDPIILDLLTAGDPTMRCVVHATHITRDVLAQRARYD